MGIPRRGLRLRVIPIQGGCVRSLKIGRRPTARLHPKQAIATFVPSAAWPAQDETRASCCRHEV
eukprot:7897282-Alexandrium_andersonii.AAC.1